MKKIDIKTYKEFRTCQKFFDAMQMKDFYRIKVRENGLTSSGENNKCHGNVLKLVKVFGGRVALGFLLLRPEYGDRSYLFNHSVWETPEGKFVDVTLNQKDLLICWNAFSDNKKEVIFTPAVVYHPDETFWEIRTYNLSFSDSIHNPIICTFANDERMMFPHNFVKRNKRQMRNLYLTKVKDDPITLGDWNDCNGGFSKPSAATGKSFDDLWNDRLTA